MTKVRDSGGSIVADLRFCGIQWKSLAGTHHCDLPLGHKDDHHCHCGEKLKRPVEKK